MSHKSISSPDAPAPIGPYSPAVTWENLVFISGQGPVDPRTGKKIEGDVTAQLAELGGMVTTANDNLKAWQGTYGTVKGGVDTAMSALTQLMGTLAPAAPVK